MMGFAESLTCTVEANMTEPENGRVLDLVFNYDPRDPWAVTVEFRQGGRALVSWLFGRDLLASGLLAASGDGDVQIGPCPEDKDVIAIRLSSPTGTAEFYVEGYPIGEWIDETYDLVPAGSEATLYNFDDELAALAAGHGKQAR